MDDRHKEKKEEPGQNVDLPLEIVHDIISRLPVKSLCRFKLVSKSWQSLINDPYFVANYSKAIENKDVFFSRRRLLFSCKRRIYSLNLDQFLNENRNAGVDGLVAAPTKLDFGSKNTILHSCCYGLFLSYVRSPDPVFSLINPVTKDSKELPKPPIWRRPMLYGVGFDYSTNEYKVINMMDYGDGVVFSVYTLQTDSWRQIDYLFPGYITPSHTDEILVNGAIYWLAWKFAERSYVIISFLLAEEEVKEILLPPNGADSYTRLGTFRNSLCITRAHPCETYNEFWVLKEYGVRESWTKVHISKPYCLLKHGN